MIGAGLTESVASHGSATRSDAADQGAQNVVAGQGQETDHAGLDPETENVADPATGKRKILKTNQNAGVQGLRTEIKIIPRGEAVIHSCRSVNSVTCYLIIVTLTINATKAKTHL